MRLIQEKMFLFCDGNVKGGRARVVGLILTEEP